MLQLVKKSIARCLVIAMASVFCLQTAVAASAPSSGNKLYFSGTDNELYYDAELFDEQLFMYHPDMEPGDTFVDTLLIENGCETIYSLYFQVIPVTNSEAGEDLLDYISMRIYNGGELMYDGSVRGLDEKDDGVDLQNSVFIGEFQPEAVSTLSVHLSFSAEYEPGEEDVTAQIDWMFWGVSDDDPTIPIIPPPETGDTPIIYLYAGICGVMLVGLVILTVIRRNKKNEVELTD